MENKITESDGASNKSLHRSAKQLLSYLRCPSNLNLRVAGFALGELRRSAVIGWVRMRR
jgi:hypothetical protein